MTPDEQQTLRAAVFRNTSRDPRWIGYWIGRHLSSEHLEPEALAGRLGIDAEQLVLLCLCRTPRTEYFREDVLAACARAGAPVNDVVRLLRQEQATASWNAGSTQGQPGWLMAASDQEPSIDAEGGHDPDKPR